MKKKTISAIILLLFSITINIQCVKAITINGEEWDSNKKCEYKGEKGTITIYYKNGKTVLINTEYPEMYVTSDSVKMDYNVLFTYEMENKVVIESQCPNFVYMYSGPSILNRSIFSVVYTTKERNGVHSFLDGKTTDIYISQTKLESLTDINNKNDEGCDGIINTTTKNLINKYLGYIHIIVPIMVLALGVYDFFGAMLASKEDDMKKAQKRFIIRLVAGVLVFLAPTIVNIIINILNTGACAIG